MAYGLRVAELPSGTVTFLFSDIEGSTRLLQRLGDRWGDVVAAHNEIMRRAFADAPDAVSDGPLIAPSTWRGPLGTRAALDYVFFRGVPRTEPPRRLPERFGSDHYPLLTVVGLTPDSVAQRFRFEAVE